jgi:hypothetical protein
MPATSYQAIIEATEGKRLKTSAPRLRVLPPPSAINPPESLDDIDVIAWAKANAACGRRLVQIPAPEPTKPKRRARQPDLRRRHAAHQKILAALPGTLEQLAAATGRCKTSVYMLLQQLLDEGRVHPIRRPGRHGAFVWTATTEDHS